MVYRIQLAPRVLEDVEEIVGYIARDSREAALRWHDRLLERIRSLQEMPARAAYAPEERVLRIGLRQVTHGKYRILFVIDEQLNLVRVLHVRHEARPAALPRDLDPWE